MYFYFISSWRKFYYFILCLQCCLSCCDVWASGVVNCDITVGCYIIVTFSKETDFYKCDCKSKVVTATNWSLAEDFEEVAFSHVCQSVVVYSQEGVPATQGPSPVSLYTGLQPWNTPIQGQISGPIPWLHCTGAQPKPRHVQTCSPWTSRYKNQYFQTCSNFFKLNFIVQGLLPSPIICLNMFISKSMLSARMRLAFNWNAFLFVELVHIGVTINLEVMYLNFAEVALLH